MLRSISNSLVLRYPNSSGTNKKAKLMNLQTYRPLGHSGLLVSPLALGTMTFGTPGWGLNEAGSRAVIEQYVELGGNFIDTADVYAGGRSEEIVGTFLAEKGLR